MSWPLVKLGDIFDITSSKRVHEKDWRSEGVPFYRAREVAVLSREGRVDNELFIDESLYEEFKNKYGIPKEGDLLVTAVGTLGKIYVVKAHDRFYFKDASVIWLRKRSEVDTSYIWHALNSVEVQRFIQNSSGATVGTYTISRANETEIPLPPLEEQKRIAAILDKADAIRRKRQQAIKLADDFLRSVFLEMFGDPVTNPKGWDVKKLSDFTCITTGNTPSRAEPKYYGDYIEWIKSDNINTPSHFLTKATEYLSLDGYNVSRTVPAGSTLVTCIAGSFDCIGNAAYADREVAFNQQINALTPKDGINSWFLYALILLSKKAIQAASTNSMKGMLSKGRMEEIELIVPDCIYQEKFGQIFSRYLALTKSLEMTLDFCGDLFNSSSKRAFQGNL